MARYLPAVDVWSLDESARAKLQPGQWIRCGDSSHLSRFYRQNVASTLAFHGPSPHATRKMLAYIAAGREAESKALSEQRARDREAAESLRLERLELWREALASLDGRADLTNLERAGLEAVKLLLPLG